MTVEQWIAVAAIAGPLIAKAFSDWSANAAAKHNLALARIIGMAGREAATIARTVAQLPVNADAPTAEKALIQSSAASILTEMGSSSATVGADAAKLTAIVQGEIDKLVVPVAVAANAAAPPRPPVTKERILELLSAL